MTIMPIRTDFDSISKDLFLPTLINCVIKTEYASTTSFIFIALFWDLATLPIRLAALPIRMCYNACVSPKEHPLMPFLKQKGIVPSYDTEGQILFDRRAGNVSILVYKIEQREGKTIRQGCKYHLHLSDREVPHFRSSWEFSSSTSN